MTQSIDRGAKGRRRSEAARVNERDVQVDKETGRPVSVPPYGEKETHTSQVEPDERLRIDPESRIPRPAQPDLA